MFHFRAALDLLDQDWGGAPGHAKGAWDAMVRRVDRADGNVVISHEILAGAKPDKIAKALNDLAGNEVHVVYSARDLGRQLPAAWQESIKQGRKWPFRRFLDQVERGQTWFFNAFDLPARAGRVGRQAPARAASTWSPCPHDRGPNGDELWLRFCRAFGIDPAWAPLDSERDNRSLGIAETSLLRKLNRRLELGVWRDPVYDALIRELLAQEVLVARDAVPVRLPPDRYDFAEQQAERLDRLDQGQRRRRGRRRGRPAPAPARRGREVEGPRPGARQARARRRPRRAVRDDAGGRQPRRDRHGRRPAPRHRASAARPVTAPSSATRPAASVHGWVAHLRAGGTTPWLEWTDPGAGDEPAGRALPGAQQLELLRRINLARAVECAAPWRRRPRAHSTRRPGARRTRRRSRQGRPAAGRRRRPPASARGPSTPPTVGAHELLRVASALLADDLVALGPDPVRRGVPRPWRRRFRLVGDPVVATAAREHLLGRGRPEGGPRPFVVAVGGPLDDLLAHTWTQRCFEHGSRPWGDWLRFWRERDQLPARVDLDDSVRRWGGRRPFVRIVTDLDRLPEHLGVRRLPPVQVPGADQAELARRDRGRRRHPGPGRRAARADADAADAGCPTAASRPSSYPQRSTSGSRRPRHA